MNFFRIGNNFKHLIIKMEFMVFNLFEKFGILHCLLQSQNYEKKISSLVLSINHQQICCQINGNVSHV